MKLFISFIFLFFISQNISSQWVVTSQPSGFDIFDCSFINTQTGYICGYGNSIFKTTSGGTNWINLSFPGTAQNINTIYFFNANTGMLVSTNDTLYRTTNGGASWDVKVNLGFPASRFFYLDNNTGWATNLGKIAKTTDGGINWVTSGSFTYGPIYFVNAMTGWTTDYSGGNSNIYKTTNGGSSWNSQYTATDFRVIYSIYFLNENTGWVSGYREFIAKTTNGGINWTEQNFTAEGAGIYSIAFVNQNTGWGAGDFSFSGGSKIFYTTNSGDNWNYIFATTNAGRLFKVQFVNQYSGWLVGQYGRVFRTMNSGGLTGVGNPGNNAPGNFELMQNYPNPFNPGTNIISRIEKNGFVTLKVYDILGKEAAVLVNENLSAGTYTYNFNASELPGGIYFYTLHSGNLSQTRKMVLIK
jgi:photosystem II stability/assembly factor-like uncharacterized protein